MATASVSTLAGIPGVPPAVAAALSAVGVVTPAQLLCSPAATLAARSRLAPADVASVTAAVVAALAAPPVPWAALWPPSPPPHLLGRDDVSGGDSADASGAAGGPFSTGSPAIDTLLGRGRGGGRVTGGLVPGRLVEVAGRAGSGKTQLCLTAAAAAAAAGGRVVYVHAGGVFPAGRLAAILSHRLVLRGRGEKVAAGGRATHGEERGERGTGRDGDPPSPATRRRRAVRSALARVAVVRVATTADVEGVLARLAADRAHAAVLGGGGGASGDGGDAGSPLPPLLLVLDGVADLLAPALGVRGDGGWFGHERLGAVQAGIVAVAVTGWGGGGGGIGGSGGSSGGDAFAGPTRATAAAAGTPYRRPALGRSWAALPSASLNVDAVGVAAGGGGSGGNRRLGVWVTSKTAPAAWTAVHLTAAGVHD
ncbi:hypothetical protein MMPV_002271 [Pyropia vietnamensis]